PVLPGRSEAFLPWPVQIPKTSSEKSTLFRSPDRFLRDHRINRSECIGEVTSGIAMTQQILFERFREDTENRAIVPDLHQLQLGNHSFGAFTVRTPSLKRPVHEIRG